MGDKRSVFVAGLLLVACAVAGCRSNGASGPEHPDSADDVDSQVECRPGTTDDGRAADGRWSSDQLPPQPSDGHTVDDASDSQQDAGCDADCEEWSCNAGCCIPGKIEPPACCLSAADCRDCVNLETWDRTLCSKEVPAGFTPDLCTNDACFAGVCVWAHKDSMGLCFNGDMMDQTACNPLTGECESIGVCETYCYGETQEDADAKCDFGSQCLQVHCAYQGPFIPWPGDLPPPGDDLATGVCECVPLPEEEICDDGDECTMDGCSHLTGCFHVLDCSVAGCCVSGN